MLGLGCFLGLVCLSVPRETPLSIKTFRVVTFLVQNLVLKMKIAIRTSQIYFLSSPHATFDGVTSGLNCPLNTSYSKKEIPFFSLGLQTHFKQGNILPPFLQATMIIFCVSQCCFFCFQVNYAFWVTECQIEMEGKSGIKLGHVN